MYKHLIYIQLNNILLQTIHGSRQLTLSCKATLRLVTSKREISAHFGGFNLNYMWLLTTRSDDDIHRYASSREIKTEYSHFYSGIKTFVVGLTGFNPRLNLGDKGFKQREIALIPFSSGQIYASKIDGLLTTAEQLIDGISKSKLRVLNLVYDKLLHTIFIQISPRVFGHRYLRRCYSLFLAFGSPFLRTWLG